jgi:7-carboxy-7-deazaguanine synthase
MKVVEIFKSISGESVNSGRLATFIRLTTGKMCIVGCRWCDEARTLTDYEEISITDIVAQVEELKCKYVIITGGEPLAAPVEDLVELITRLHDLGIFIEIETSGAFSVKHLKERLLNKHIRVYWTIDYKLKGSQAKLPFHPDNLKLIQKEKLNKPALKFVISDQEDLEEAIDLVKKYRLAGKATVLFHTEWSANYLPEIAKAVIEQDLNVKVGVQLHKYLEVN